MRPGPGRRLRRFYPPVERFDADEVEARFPLTIIGPDGGYTFEGSVTLETAIVPREVPYLMLVKTWAGRPNPPWTASRWLCPATEFAGEMRSQSLEVAIDRYGTGRVFRSRQRWEWERRVGRGPHIPG